MLEIKYTLQVRTGTIEKLLPIDGVSLLYKRERTDVFQVSENVMFRVNELLDSNEIDGILEIGTIPTRWIETPV